MTFGSIVSGNAEAASLWGYAGKRYDPATGSYDYGFRDCAPSQGRFTTVDPIRDGSNWYAYCDADPVNYVDLWGLCSSASDGNEYKDESIYETFWDNSSSVQKATNEIAYQRTDISKCLYAGGDFVFDSAIGIQGYAGVAHHGDGNSAAGYNMKAMVVSGSVVVGIAKTDISAELNIVSWGRGINVGRGNLYADVGIKLGLGLSWDASNDSFEVTIGSVTLGGKLGKYNPLE